MRACPKCQRTFPDDTDFCPRDGSPLAAAPAATEAELAACLAPSRTKYVVIGLLLVATIIGAVPCFSQSGSKQETQQTQPTPQAAATVRGNPKDGLKYVWIPLGTFKMGCSPGDSECFDDEKPSHQVALSKGFWIGQTEVTVGAYKRFASLTGHEMPSAPTFNSGWNNDAQPIVNISWNDAQAFCQWAAGRLPTEAEWEYAARGGSTEARYGPLDEVAWYRDNSDSRAREVGQKRANSFGLFDMLGNVWEWVSDWYDQSYYARTPSVDPPGPSSGQERVLRVLRGGSWSGGPRHARSSSRGRYAPDKRRNDFGCRCVREVGNP